MAVREILKLGNPELYRISPEAGQDEVKDLVPAIKDLQDTLFAFRKKFGFGRAIAAPQIGIHKRVIFLFVDQPIVIINPSLDQRSRETMILWDDCMSFPELLVRVKRHRRARLRYKDMKWNDHLMYLEGGLSELIQHEYDHLDGILAVQRAIDKYSYALDSQKGLLKNE
jgi:peptide deformylase